MKDIEKISYRYNKNSSNPITYMIQTKTVTTTLDYKDALEIAYSVIESLNGGYKFLDDLTEKYEVV